MSTTDLLNDIKLRYRHSFTTDQVLLWMNEAQRELFEILEIDAGPFTIDTAAGANFYVIPDGLDINKIKAVSLQMNDLTDQNGTYLNPLPTPQFQEVPYKRLDDNQPADEGNLWYTIVGDTFYFNVPGGMKDYRLIYIYTDASANTISESVDPSLPVKYHEILKLSTLERIAAARKDLEMKNNFAIDKQSKIEDFVWLSKMKEPEWSSPADVLPRAGWWR